MYAGGGTSCFSRRPFAAQYIFLVRHWLYVGRIHTVAHSAQMVKSKTFGDWSDK